VIDDVSADHDDVVYGPDGHPLDLIPPSWLASSATAQADYEGRDEPAPTPITVRDLAAAIGLPVHTVYRLLDKDAIPGVFKLDATRRKSRYYIPPDASQRFLARGDREEF
jgi:hypothetical protein